MTETASFADIYARIHTQMTPAERRVADYLQANRETAIMASAADLAEIIGTSDATIIRTARRMGFDKLDALRRALASDMRRELTLADRLNRSLDRVDRGSAGILSQIIKTQRDALDALEVQIPAADFDQALNLIGQKGRKIIFGIGPSGHIAGYFAQQLIRLGADAYALQNTGLNFADDLVRLKKGDVIIALAYDRPYPEITTLFDRATELVLPRLLITAPTQAIPDSRANVTLRVPLGQSDSFSLLAATLTLIEALIVGFANKNRARVLENLKQLNRFRKRLAGDGLGL